MTIVTKSNSPYKVSAGFTETGDVVSSGGSMYVLSAAVADFTTVKSGGFLTVSSGGTDGNAAIAGKETVLGFDLVTSILKGGTAVVSSGGTDIDATVASGGLIQILSGGVVRSNTNNSGLVEAIAPGGLVAGGEFTNTGKIGALGASAGLTVSSASILSPASIASTGTGGGSGGSGVLSGGSTPKPNTSQAVLFASGAGAHVDLDNANVLATTLVTSGGSATIETVSGTQDEIGDVVLAPGSLLKVNDDSQLKVAGTIVNYGTISAAATSDVTMLEVVDKVSLKAGGKVLLSPSGQAIVMNATPSATLDNFDNTIAGAGQIGNGGGLTLINNGIIDADAGAGFYFETGSSPVNNGGTLEATSSSKIVLDATTINNGVSGLIAASGVNTEIMLGGATIDGGTLKTAGANAAIMTQEDTPNTISDATVAAGASVEAVSGGTLFVDNSTIDGTVKASGGEVILSSDHIAAGGMVETLAGGTAGFGNTSNSGVIFASGAGSLITFLGAVSGGVTKIGNGTVELGGNEAIAFVSGGTGALDLFDAAINTSNYHGKISGFGQNTSQTIDLVNVKSDATVSATYQPGNFIDTIGTLIVSSGGVVVADIDFVGHYITAAFKLGQDGNGDITITDPPIAGGAHAANLGLFGQQIAASLVHGGGVATGTHAEATSGTEPPHLQAPIS